MAWALKSAVVRGKAIELAMENKIEGAEPEAQALTWTYPSFKGQTQAQFKAMVKREARALIDDMNAPAHVVDVTPDYAELQAAEPVKPADAEEREG